MLAKHNLPKANFGFIGLGVMGSMLARNMQRNGFRVAGYDLDPEKVRRFSLEPEMPGDFPPLIPAFSLDELLAVLERPRRIMLMTPAGIPLEAALESVKTRLEPGDLLIDGGNSHFLDTERRSAELEAQGIIYIGTGISGGEQGALWGPAIMPGGQPQAWELVRPIFESIAARFDGEPCVAYMGPRGAGHYVKMVHNGIEYGDMQLIAETYDLLRRGLRLDNAQLSQIFQEWNQGELESYLIEITADIFTHRDPESDAAVVDLIRDEAQQKGTGRWTAQNALDLGVATPTLNAAVEARILSAYKNERLVASEMLTGPQTQELGSLQEISELVSQVGAALYAAKICAYAQGFALLRLSSQEYGYDLQLHEIARIWRGGCIIRARLLQDIRQAYLIQPDLPNLMMDPALTAALNSRQAALRRVVVFAAENGIPALAFGSALAYYDAYRSARLPANLTQAQRDYFGAHTYRRTDKEGVFHTEWTKHQAAAGGAQ